MLNARAKLPSRHQLRALLDYDPQSGILTWKTREGPPRHVGAHNKRFAGRPAGCNAANRGYLIIEINGKPRFAHRIIYKWMTGKEPYILDHINCNGLDNRWSNLRVTDDRLSQGNRRGWKSREGLPKGVSKTASGNYRAYMTQHGKYVHLGTFQTKAEGSDAYIAAAEKYFGEFARRQ